MTDKIVTPSAVIALKASVATMIDEWVAALPAAGGTTVPPTTFPPPVDVAATIGATSVTLRWSAPSTAPGTVFPTYEAGHDVGTPGDPQGAWEGALPSSARSTTLDKLVPGTSYLVHVTAVYPTGTGTWQQPITIPASTGGGGTDPQPGTGAVTWNSGVWTNQDAKQALAFEKQRGQALGNIVVFTSRGNWDSNLSQDWKKGIPAGFKGNLVIKLPLWTEDGNHGRVEDWQTLARQIAAVDQNAWICLGWENNLKGWPWSMTAANQGQWAVSYRDAVLAMRSAAPSLRFAWNPNVGADQTGGNQRAAFQALKALHTGYGIDSYDSYPADTNQQAWTTHLTAVGFLGESYQYAQANGMQFVLPEWAATSGSQWGNSKGFDNPKWINDVMGFLKSKQHETVTLASGLVVPSIGFESYFSEPAAYLRSDWASNPKAAAAYAAQFAVKA